MIVERIWTGNSYRNYNYLVACPDTGEALAIDPLDHEKCLATAKAKGWNITQILNTHEHHDHIGGNDAVVAATGAVDLVTDGERVVRLANGHELMTRVTALGCALSAVVAAFCAVGEDAFEATVSALAVYGVAGEMAAELASRPGSYRVAFMDMLDAITAADVAARLKVL